MLHLLRTFGNVSGVIRREQIQAGEMDDIAIDMDWADWH